VTSGVLSSHRSLGLSGEVTAEQLRACEDRCRNAAATNPSAHAKTAGVLYQAHLRNELTRRLGVAWQPVVNGHADIDGVERGLIETFSRRRAQIVDHLASRRETSASAAQTATLATRQAKGERLSEAELRGSWTRRAREVGIRPGWHRHLLARTTPRTPELAGLAAELIDREAITARSSSFTRRDVLQALAERLPTGLPVALVEMLADKILDHHPELLVELGPTRGQLTQVDVIRRADGRIVAADDGERRYTTRGLLLTEQRAIDRSSRPGCVEVRSPASSGTTSTSTSGCSPSTGS
jgi:hypothetical protein